MESATVRVLQRVAGHLAGVVGERALHLVHRRSFLPSRSADGVLVGTRPDTPRGPEFAGPHATAPDLENRIGIGKASSSAAGLSRQGLYNVLEDMTRAGLVRCVEPAGSSARYELRVGDNHHHVVCRECGRVEDIDCTVGTAPCLDPGEDKGFTIDEAEITWWGICDRCKATT